MSSLQFQKGPSLVILKDTVRLGGCNLQRLELRVLKSESPNANTTTNIHVADTDITNNSDTRIETGMKTDRTPEII